MLAIYKTKAFERCYCKERISDDDLDEAIKDVIHSKRGGLGHKLFKKRMGSSYKGKRGSYHSIVYYRTGSTILFLHLYSKNEKVTISPTELKAFILLSKDLDKLTETDIQRLVTLKEFVRYEYEKNI